MNSSFYNGVSGMKTAQVGIDVWGDNIANVNTIGYKQQDLDFSTIFSTTMATMLNSPATSDKGYSATATTTVMNLSQGSIKPADGTFDMALAGRGWMVVKDQNNQDFYTRTGSFVRDLNGELVNQNGEKLQVVNANNLTFSNGRWNFDTTIPTDNLVASGAQLSSIALPNNVVFPATATKHIGLSGNLPNQNRASDSVPANSDSEFGVLYNSKSESMQMQNRSEVVFGFGDNVTYKKDLLRYHACIENDKVDGQDVNVDFYVNDKHIKFTLPDGSTSKEISDAISQELTKNNILHDKADTFIEIKDQNQINIKSNGGFVVKANETIRKLVYRETDNSGNNFTTMGDFTAKLQDMANLAYPNSTKVSINKDGKIMISNNTDKTEVVVRNYETGKSNKEFMINLGHLGSNIKPNTDTTSLEFKHNYQGFSGDIIDADGNRNSLDFSFYKAKVRGDQTTWNLTISEVNDEGKVVSKTAQTLVFGDNGLLISPNPATFTLNNAQKTVVDFGKDFAQITGADRANTGFTYAQDGMLQGYLQNYDVKDTGEIVATFSNGMMGTLGQIPIYHFQNEQGLDAVGANKYTPTNNSGEAFLYGNGEYIAGAKVLSHSLETSNVSLAQAMTQIIVTQKAFDANSKSITTSDQMIQKAIDMKR